MVSQRARNEGATASAAARIAWNFRLAEIAATDAVAPKFDRPDPQIPTMNRAAHTAEFANEMIVERAAERVYPRRGWLLVGLLLVCFAPRVWMAGRLDVLCNDAVFYIEHAQGIEHGDLEAGLGRLRLNVYPPVLALLHSLGLEWHIAGKIWGVALASLTVLPLFGWLRRQFDETLAVVGCLLYAVHPRLIECSPELIRDPTFWFFWTLGLYTSWRAAAEMRFRWYFAAGIAITLAIHTRFEGWFLYLPLVGWSLCRATIARTADGFPDPPSQGGRSGRPSPEGKRRIARSVAGCSAAFLMCPLVVVAINVTWLAGQPRWELGNFNRLEYATLWSKASWRAIRGDRPPHAGAKAASSDLPLTPADAPLPAALAPQATILSTSRMGMGRTLWAFVNALRRGFGVTFGLCWLVGFACRPRVWLRRDHLVLFLVAGCVAAGAWIHLWYAQATSSRYFLALVLLGTPCAATGCCWTLGRAKQAIRWLLRVFSRNAGRQNISRCIDPWSATPSAAAAIVAVLLTAGIAETLASSYEGRHREAALGRWIRAEFGQARSIVTPRPLGLLGFYAQATTHALAMEPAALDGNADLAVVLPHVATPKETQAFVDAARNHGLHPIDRRCLPQGHDWRDVMVLVSSRIPHSAFRTF